MRQTWIGWIAGLAVVAGAARLAGADTAADQLAKGEAAYAAGQFEPARDAFAAAVAADPKNRRAAVDLGVALLRLGQPAKAAKPLEGAMAATKGSPDRPLAMALACEYVSNHSPMQAAKPLLAYTRAHPADPPDEAVVDALGTAVAQAEAKGVRTALFTDAKSAYAKLSAKLEATRPGEKRWGPDWMPAADVDAKRAAVAEATTTVARQTAQLNVIDAQVASLTRHRNALPDLEGDNNVTQHREALQKQIEVLTADREKTAGEVDTARKTLAESAPKWPDRIPVDGLTLAAGDDGGK